MAMTHAPAPAGAGPPGQRGRAQRDPRPGAGPDRAGRRPGRSGPGVHCALVANGATAPSATLPAAAGGRLLSWPAGLVLVAVGEGEPGGVTGGGGPVRQRAGLLPGTVSLRRGRGRGRAAGAGRAGALPPRGRALFPAASSHPAAAGRLLAGVPGRPAAVHTPARSRTHAGPPRPGTAPPQRRSIPMVKQQRAQRTREALVESAAAVFDREGFSVASLTTISSRAGVSTGALHFHFASKAALADAVEDAAAGRLGAITRYGEDGAGDALQCLVDATHDLARGLSADVVLRAGFALGGDHVYAAKRDLRRLWRQWVEKTLQRAAGEGGLHETVTPQDAVITLVAATAGFEVLGAGDPAWLSYRTLTRFWQLLLPRLASASALGRLTAQGRGTGTGAGARAAHNAGNSATPGTKAAGAAR
ncbi:ScbR family autoregulator-binding transcription factor [Streptomyces sp. NPDC005486]|uniref:ScbR family autoregulator-binding transcription factor n=1 Tax=Streptomyces sp. NPDC005486 TaxID=3155345 RepID=UPI0033A2D5EB